MLAPVCIALLMIAWGTQVTQRSARRSAAALTSTAWRLSWLGIALALYVFMADALRAVPHGLDATRTVLPTAFNWPVFLVALALMAAPIADLALEVRIDGG